MLLVVTDAAQKLALDSDRCVQILREAGHLDTTSMSCVVDLGYIPDGLNAAEVERYLPQAVAKLQQGATAAATTLLKVMLDQGTPASVKVRAAECVMNHSSKAIEIRVSELERAAEAQKKK